MSSGQIGLNGREASAALSKIESSYQNLIGGFNNLQSGVVDKIGASWFGEDAREFANNKYKPAIEEATNEIQKVFQSINDTITQNAQNFERKHNVNVFSKVPHSPRKVNINTGVVKSDEGGFIGIKSVPVLKEAIAGAQKLVQEAIAQLEAAKSAAARSGFYGENQQERLDASMSKIKSSLEDLTRELQQATKAKIEAVETEEKSIAQQNASTM